MCVEELVGPVCLLYPVCLVKGLVAREGAAVGGDIGVTVPVGKHRVACAVKVWPRYMLGCVGFAD